MKDDDDDDDDDNTKLYLYTRVREHECNKPCLMKDRTWTVLGMICTIAAGWGRLTS
jgi:hypothetical protein